MNRKPILSTLLIVILLSIIGITQIAEAQGPQPRAPRANIGTTFTYQGQLKSGGAAYSGACDFQFKLYDDSSAGTQIGSTQIASSVSVASGFFTTQIDFGASTFNGNARWLDISVRCPAGIGSYTALAPRQAITPAPMALALPGLYTQQNATSPNLIGGYSGNVISNTVVGGTIGGGGQSGFPNRVWSNYATVGGGANNTASGSYAIVAGGENNTASNNHATIGGGTSNTASWDFSTIGGGANNTTGAYYATVGGGVDNIASGSRAVVGGGESNDATGNRAFVGGGDGNTASGYGATIGGGLNNIASGTGAFVGGGGYDGTNSGNSASGIASTIGGGLGNSVSGKYATIPGGINNSASLTYTFAAGRRAKANHEGAFVWGDATDADVASTATNQFVVRASNGLVLRENAGGSKTVNTGEYYRDNSIIAWGRIYSSGTIAYDYGISSVSHSTGVYTITLTAFTQNSLSLIPNVTAVRDTPPTSASLARLITIRQYAFNQFIVYITNGNYTLVDEDFVFTITGR